MAGVVQIRCDKCLRRNSVKSRNCSGCGKKFVDTKAYWVRIPIPGGSFHTEFIGKFSSKLTADHRLRELQNQIAEEKYIRKDKNTEWTLIGILKWYLELGEVKQQSSFRDKTLLLEKAVSKIGGNKKISELSLDDIEIYKRIRTEETVGKPAKKIKTATINRDLAYLRSMLNIGIRHGKLESNPFSKLTMLDENNIRERILSKKEFDRLVNACPKHLKPVVITAFFLPMRKGEILGLTWDQVFLKKRYLKISGFDRNNKKHRRTVPLHDRVIEALRGLESRFHPSKRVFLDNKGKPFKDCRGGFNSAVEKAELGDFHFHDLRHCAINNLRQAGNDYLKIMAASGHRTIEVFQRYNMVSSEEVKGMKWLEEESVEHDDVHALD